MNLQQVVKQEELELLVRRDLGDKAGHINICLDIIGYLCASKYDDVRHLTYQSFVEITHKRIEDVELVESLQYLNGMRAETLVSSFEFIDEFDNTYVLDDEQVRALKDSGVFVHPFSGEVVAKAEEHIYMFFSPGNKIKTIQSIL